MVRRSPAATRLAVRLVGTVQGLADRRLPPEERWKRRSSAEVRYWRDALSADVGARFSDRLDPAKPVKHPALRMALSEIGRPHVFIVDVGSGPLTSVGLTYPGKTLDVVATDALADDYSKIVQERAIVPPVPVVRCSGDELVSRFGRAVFDIAFSANALDHMTDPMRVLHNMLELVKPDGRVCLFQMRNEGERNAYMGIHFWNVDRVEGRLVFWNRSERHVVDDMLAGRFEVESWVTRGDDERVHAVIRPLSSTR